MTTTQSAAAHSIPTRTRSKFTGLRSAGRRIGGTPVRAAGTTGRGIELAVNVLRDTVIDTFTLKLPVSEFLWQAWVLLKVTAIPAVLRRRDATSMPQWRRGWIVRVVSASSVAS